MNMTDMDLARDKHDWYGKISSALVFGNAHMFVLEVRVQYTIKQYIANLPTQYPYQYVIIKYLYLILTQFWRHIKTIDCISCPFAVSVLLICGQLFKLRTYSCVSLFYVCYCISLLPIPSTTNISIYQQYEVHYIDMQCCSIVPALVYMDT